MKKANKKHIKKLFVGLGAAATVVAPIASSVSFATNPALASFINKINDHSTDNDSKKLIDAEQQQKIENWLTANGLLTDSPKNDDKGSFVISDVDTLYAKLKNLSTDTTFTPEVRVAIGKWIINRYSFTHFLKDKGVWTANKVTQSELETINQDTIKDPIITKHIIDGNGVSHEEAIDYTFGDANTKIQVQGKTGLNTEWKTHDDNDNVFNISNQDVLNYFVGAFSNSNEFNDLYSQFVKNRSLWNANPTDKSLKSLFIDYFAKANVLLNSATSSLTTKDELLEIDLLKNLFNETDLSKVTTDDNVYLTILGSGIGKQLFGNNVSGMISDFQDSNYSDEEKLADISTLLRKLNSQLLKMQAVNNKQFDQIATNSEVYIDSDKDGIEDKVVPLADRETAEEIYKFGKLLLDYSNNFQNDVQLRILSHDFREGTIMIKTGHDIGAWNIIPDDAFKMSVYQPSSSGADDSKFVFRDYKASEPAGNKLGSIVVGTGKATKQLNPDNSNLWVVKANDSSGGVLSTGNERWARFALNLVLNNQVFGMKPESVDMDVDDHGADDSIKNTVTTTTSEWVGPHEGLVPNPNGPYPVAVPGTIPGFYHNVTTTNTVPWSIDIPAERGVTWIVKQNETTIPNLLNGTQIEFRWTESDELNHTRSFDELTNAINKNAGTILTEINAKIKDWHANPTLNPNYDLLANTTIKITLTNITFGEIRYNTYDDWGYDDTHVDNIRMTKVTASFSYEVSQEVI